MDTTTSVPAPPAKLSDKVKIVVPEFKTNDWGHIQGNNHFPDETYNGTRKPAFMCKVEVSPGLILRGYFLDGRDDEMFIQPEGGGYWHTHWIEENEVDPFFLARVIGNGTTRKITIKNHNYGYGYHSRPSTETLADTYDVGYYSVPGWQGSHNNQLKMPWIYLEVEITHPDTGSVQTVTLRVKAPDAGVVDLTSYAGTHNLTIHNQFFGHKTGRAYSCLQWSDFIHLLTCSAYDRKQSDTTMWAWWLDALNTPTDLAHVETASVKSLWNRKAFKPNFARLADEEPLLHRFLLWLHSKVTADGTTNNKLLAAFFKATAADYNALVRELEKAMAQAPAKGSYAGGGYGKYIPNRGICLGLPGADERERVRREKKEWSFRKGAAAQAEGLGLDAARHPKTLAALEAGDIPISIFHEPGNKDHHINVEFDLWEKALSQDGWAEPLCKIAKAAASRSTYSKRVTSYIGFLFKLPIYLDRHAPRPGRGKNAKWRAMPKFVESQWELEMDEATEDGTTKQRSALTPVPDNDTGVIEVPYAAIAIHGRQTTYCYSDQYFVAEAGLNDPNGEGIFVEDLEVKLNGRDDYGLMWYTLMGTPRNTGYPSFLVIFERLPTRTDLKLSTRVHFHRVHPNRTKKGILTPTCRLIRECYRYMAGNVTVDEIDTQQGDLIFIRRDGPGKAVDPPMPVESFESHSFVPLTGEEPVKLIASVAKSPTNRLGYLHSEVAFKVTHPEHEDIAELEAGWWEVRRTKSFEANPVAVWSMVID